MLEMPHKYRTFADPPPEANPWLKVDGRRSSPSSSPPPSGLHRHGNEVEAGNRGNVDQVLFKNLVEMVPLVESLMDQRTSSCFTRRSSMVYTPAPSQSKMKATGQKYGKVNQTVSSRKMQKDFMDIAKINSQNAPDDDLSSFLRGFDDSNSQDRKELINLREQVNDLERKLLEKDEALKSKEVSINQMNATYALVDDLKTQLEEKDAVVKSINSQLYNAKICLADKQAALEKITWESKMSNRKIEELEAEIISMENEMDMLMQIFERLSFEALSYSDGDVFSYDIEPLEAVDNIDEYEMLKIEEARAAYEAAVAAAKENPGDETIATVAAARERLQALMI